MHHTHKQNVSIKTYLTCSLVLTRVWKTRIRNFTVVSNVFHRASANIASVIICQLYKQVNQRVIITVKVNCNYNMHTSSHVPVFKQGSDAHKSMSISQLEPVKPV